MKNKENYLIKILLILIIIPSMWWYFSTKKRYREMNTTSHIEMDIKKFLKKRYNEDFEVKATPYIYDDYCRALIIPKRYIGTSKEHDLFYKAEAYVVMEKVAIINEYRQDVIGSSYNEILIKEDLEKMCKPKLEELFGKNVLVALQLEGMCYYKNCKEELEHRKKEKNQKPLSGGIYIFGRVESEEDREKYRRGIYEFIQYLKQEGMFEYVDMTIFITDERFLSKEFDKLGIHEKLLENYREYRKTRKSNQKRTPEEVHEFVKKKQKIYSEIGENYTLDTSKIDKISRYEVIDLNENLMCGIVAVVRIVSEKAIKTNYFLRDEKIKKYDKLEDVELE